MEERLAELEEMSKAPILQAGIQTCTTTIPLTSQMRTDTTGSIKNPNDTQGKVGWAEPSALCSPNLLRIEDTLQKLWGTGEKISVASEVLKRYHTCRKLF